MKELLAEAEIVLKNAPMQVGGEDCWRMGWFLDRTQVRGDMVDAEGPMGPDQQTWGGWWSVLLTLGSDHPRVREPPTRRMISILTISIRSFLLGLIWTTTSTTSISTMSDYLPRPERIQLWSHWRQVEVELPSICFQIVIVLLCNFSFEFPFRSSLHAFWFQLFCFSRWWGCCAER